MAKPLKSCANVNAVRSRCIVRLQLALPWTPILSWVWGVKHVFGDLNSNQGTVFIKHIGKRLNTHLLCSTVACLMTRL